MKKRFLIFILLAVGIHFGTAFASQDAFQWHITVLDAKVAASLDSTSTIVEYGGTTSKVANSNQSGDGNVYLLLHLDLQKTKTGGKGFTWKAVHLADEEGATFSRMKNDAFLRTHGYDRLQSTNIQLSSNGWICFEVPEVALAKKLYFVHQANEGENRILIEKQ